MSLDALMTHFKNMNYNVFVSGNSPSRVLGVIKGTVGSTFHENEWREFMEMEQMEHINAFQNKVTEAIEDDREPDHQQIKITGKVAGTFNEVQDEVVINFAADQKFTLNHVEGFTYIKLNDEVKIFERDSIRCEKSNR